jgi:uncharacterized protein (TIGR02646 family)
MKHINKRQAPHALTRWVDANQQLPQNLVYNRAGFPHAAVLDALLQEQGFLCAYTLTRINENAAHVEHIKPQTCCRREDEQREANGHPCQREDIAWRNVVACFPESSPPVPPTYGAVVKGSWWEPHLFVSPLQNGCENRFWFTPDGKVVEADETDAAARTTIEKIALGNPRLCELRETAYKRAGVHRRSDKPITSLAKVEQLIAGWVHRHRETGAYAEFCIPLVQVAKDYAQFLRQRGVRA